MKGEQVYLFRHALLRDAAYQLQLPGDRARLHGLAVEVIEEVCGGRAPDASVPRGRASRGGGFEAPRDRPSTRRSSA